MQEKRVLDQ